MMAKAKTKITNMEGLGFTKVDDTIIPRLIASISGLDKQGKTHFGLTAPAPIAIFDTDVGNEGVARKFAHKELHTIDVGVPTDEGDEDNGEAKEMWESFRTAYYGALENKHVRSLLIDTGTEIWELLRLASFGKLTQVMPYMYGPVNKEFRKLIRDSYKYDKNVLWIHKMKSKYINDKRTAEYERAGFGDMPFLVQLNAQVWRYGVEDGGEFVLTIDNSRHDPDLMGMDLEGPMCVFQMLASLVMPEVDVEVWE